MGKRNFVPGINRTSSITGPRVFGGKKAYFSLTNSPSTFNVLSLSPSLWLDASDWSTLFQNSSATTPVTANGDAIGSWRDKSGNARHFTQSGATRPTLSISGGVSRIAFTGGQNLDAASASMITSGNQNFTILIVYEPNQGTSTGFVFGNFSAGNLAVYVDTALPAYASPFGVYLNADVDLSSDTYSTGVKLITIRRSSGSIIGWQATTQKNTVSNSQSVYSGAGTSSVWSIGCNTINSEAFDGWIREIIVVDSAISAANLLALQTHLVNKHGAS